MTSPAPSLEANQRTCFSAVTFTAESNTSGWARKSAVASRTTALQRARSNGKGRGGSRWRFGASREKLGARSLLRGAVDLPRLLLEVGRERLLVALVGGEPERGAEGVDVPVERRVLRRVPGRALRRRAAASVSSAPEESNS